jgi:hypothetical protein
MVSWVVVVVSFPVYWSIVVVLADATSYELSTSFISLICGTDGLYPVCADAELTVSTIKLDVAKIVINSKMVHLRILYFLFLLDKNFILKRIFYVSYAFDLLCSY